MARQITEKSNIRKIFKIGGGKCYGVTIPIDIIRLLGFRDKQNVRVTRRGTKIIIEEWRE